MDVGARTWSVLEKVGIASLTQPERLGVAALAYPPFNSSTLSQVNFKGLAGEVERRRIVQGRARRRKERKRRRGRGGKERGEASNQEHHNSNQ